MPDTCTTARMAVFDVIPAHIAVLDGRGIIASATCHSPAEERWFQLTVTPLPDGQPNRAVVMHLNISERKAAEEALKAFRLSAEQARHDLNLGARTGSLRIASEAAHRLKSGASTIGATRLAEVCAVIEANTVAGGVAAFSALLPRFEVELRAVYRFLDSSPAGTR